MDQSKPWNAAPLDQEALVAELLARADSMRAYITRHIPAALRNEIEPEDVLQEVWMAAFASVSTYRPTRPDALDRWLAGIMNHKLIDFCKTEAALKRGGHGRDQSTTRLRRSPLNHVIRHLAAPRRTPSGEFRRREAADAVQSALTRLRPDRRTALLMRYVDERPQQEIARRMDKSESAVSALLFQALQDLRRWLGNGARYLSDEGLPKGGDN